MDQNALEKVLDTYTHSFGAKTAFDLLSQAPKHLITPTHCQLVAVCCATRQDASTAIELCIQVLHKTVVTLAKLLFNTKNISNVM